MHFTRGPAKGIYISSEQYIQGVELMDLKRALGICKHHEADSSYLTLTSSSSIDDKMDAVESLKKLGVHAEPYIQKLLKDPEVSPQIKNLLKPDDKRDAA
jgi:hypothetical protein